MATMNPQKREEARYTGGITGASTVNSTYANGSNAPILSGQSLATAMFGSGSPAVTFDYSSPKTSVAKKTTTRSATPTAAPKPSVSASVAMAKTAPKVSSRPSGESYSAPKPKATVTSRADSASNNKPAARAAGPTAQQIASAKARSGGTMPVYTPMAATAKKSKSKFNSLAASTAMKKAAASNTRNH